MTERMDFADGKYTVINDNGNLTALRHGESWQRDLTGDNLVYWMLVEALELKRQRDELLAFSYGLYSRLTTRKHHELRESIGTKP